MSEQDNEKPIKPITKAQQKLLDAAVSIGMNSPTEKEAFFMARELVQCTLPHKNPGDKPIWIRKNGSLTLAIQPGFDLNTGKSIGYPYGTIPRLLLFWMTTEAVKGKSTRANPRRLELGNSLSDFMLALGLDPSRGGVRSDARRLQDQMQRFFSSLISFQIAAKINSLHGEARLNMPITDNAVYWWTDKNPKQGALWGSWIELGHRFFEAITASPVPVDMRALQALRRSPLALDLYAWLTYESYRAHKNGKGRFVAWTCLMEQLGGEYSNPGDFGKKARAALRKVQLVYPALKLGAMRAGVRIDPESFPAIQPRPEPRLCA